MNGKSEEKQVTCPCCGCSVKVMRRTLVRRWDGAEWQHASFGGWTGHCPNHCGFVSGDGFFSYGLRPQRIGVVL